MKIAQKCLILATSDQGQGQCRPSTYGFLLFFFHKTISTIYFLVIVQELTVEIPEPLLMGVEPAVFSLLVELSDMTVTRDIDCQGPLTEHVVHQEDGQEIKLSAQVMIM